MDKKSKKQLERKFDKNLRIIHENKNEELVKDLTKENIRIFEVLRKEKQNGKA